MIKENNKMYDKIWIASYILYGVCALSELIKWVRQGIDEDVWLSFWTGIFASAAAGVLTVRWHVLVGWTEDSCLRIFFQYFLLVAAAISILAGVYQLFEGDMNMGGDFGWKGAHFNKHEKRQLVEGKKDLDKTLASLSGGCYDGRVFTLDEVQDVVKGVSQLVDEQRTVSRQIGRRVGHVAAKGAFLRMLSWLVPLLIFAGCAVTVVLVVV